MSGFPPQVKDLSKRIICEAGKRGLLVGTAESCTGGLVSAALTSVAGSSAVVRGGIVSYAPEVKRAVLGVSQDVIDDCARGVVSSDCAREMCLGARRVLGCDIAVSVTGIAGPGGAEPGKPVGTVWFGIAGARGARTQVQHFPGERQEVRLQACQQALALIYEAIMEFED